MSGKGRAAIVLFGIALAGGGAAVYLHAQEEEAASVEAVDVADASADARAGGAKKKKAAAKKKAPAKSKRGGKTRVTGRPASGGGTKPSSPTRASPPSRAHAPRPSTPTGPAGPSYETALGSSDEQVSFGGHGGPDLTDMQLAAPMSDGSFLGECGAPDSMGVTVKVAITHGRAVGVTVETSPHSAEVARCIDHHVRGLTWPSSPKMDSFVTTY